MKELYPEELSTSITSVPPDDDPGF